MKQQNNVTIGHYILGKLLSPSTTPFRLPKSTLLIDPLPRRTSLTFEEEDIQALRLFCFLGVGCAETDFVNFFCECRQASWQGHVRPSQAGHAHPHWRKGKCFARVILAQGSIAELTERYGLFVGRWP